MNTKKLFFLLLATFLIVGGSCQTDPLLDAPKAVVEKYMSYTLGTIPGASVDYDAAKTLITPDLEEEFTDPMFVPTSYCIQDGPSDVEVFSTYDNQARNWVEIIVQAQYGEDWIPMWEFIVVPVEGDDWLVHQINCLNS